MTSLVRTSLARMALLAAVALPASQSPPSLPPASEIRSALSGLGYKIVSETAGRPCWEEFEKQTFGMTAKREWAVKSVMPVGGVSRTYYRFVIWEEVFPGAKKAQARLESLKSVPACAPVEQREYWIVTGFRLGSRVILLSTDAVLFEKEMGRFSKRLETALADKGNARD